MPINLTPFLVHRQAKELTEAISEQIAATGKAIGKRLLLKRKTPPKK